MQPTSSTVSGRTRSLRDQEEIDGEPISLRGALWETALLLARKSFAALVAGTYAVRFANRYRLFGVMLKRPQALTCVAVYMETRIPARAREEWLWDLMVSPLLPMLRGKTCAKDIEELLAQVPVPESQPV